MVFSTKNSDPSVDNLKQRLYALREAEQSADLMVKQLEEELKEEKQKTKQIENAIINARLQAEIIEKNAKDTLHQLIELKEQEMQAKLSDFEMKFRLLKATAHKLSKQENQLQVEVKSVLNKSLISIDEISFNQIEKNERVDIQETDKQTTMIQFPDTSQSSGDFKTPVYVFSNQ